LPEDAALGRVEMLKSELLEELKRHLIATLAPWIEIALILRRPSPDFHIFCQKIMNNIWSNLI
jgi:hypothetical protein